MTILLDNATLATMDRKTRVLEAQKLIIQNGVIVEFGEQVKTGAYAIDETFNCSGKIVIPGLVNTHAHLTEVLQRSFRDNVRKELWLHFRQMTEDAVKPGPEEIEAAAELACAEMLKNGITAVLDHFSIRSGLTAANMRAVLTAFEKTGIRGILAPSLRDQDFLALMGVRSYSRKATKGPSAVPMWEEILSVLEHVRKGSRIFGLMLGPSSPQNCSDALLRKIIEMAERYDLGVHTHLLESRIERWGAWKLGREGLVERLGRLGLLSSRLSAAHCIWLDNREIDLLASSGTSVVHNPASNLKLGSGIAPVVRLKKRGVNIALGTDGGDTSDTYSIFEQMKLAAFLSRLDTENPRDWVTAPDALSMGTLNGANAIPMWRGKIGQIKAGYSADLVILKPQLGIRPLNNIAHQLVFCHGGLSVDTVIVDGKVVVREGHLTQVNEEELIQKIEPISQKMYRRYGLIKEHPNRLEASVGRLYQTANRSRTVRSIKRYPIGTRTPAR
jgi:cytosine/adenosine deaminase-related metal-dependent hydrolase